MAWIGLKNAVSSIIKNNDNQEITGQILQNVLNSIVSNVGQNATFGGIATPSTNPGLYDGNVFYLATQEGIYSNFGGIVLDKNEAVVLEWREGSWLKYDCGFATKEMVDKISNIHIPPMSQSQFDELEKNDMLIEGSYYNIYEDE